ncbi:MULTISPECIES: hypothetical protein [Prevotellaceae]|uniref:hypothetical protein n=1 Tax=Prevotellaceae TaxID=171552 RepID=UPI00345F57AD
MWCIAAVAAAITGTLWSSCISDTRTPAQKEAMKLLILRLHREFPDIKTILGHRDLPGMQKACPCFDATKLQPLLAS